MPASASRNSLNALQTLTVGERTYGYFSLKAAEHTLGDLSHLPCCMRILLENLLRFEDEEYSTQDDMRALTAYHALHKNIPTISFHPSRFLIDDTTALSTLSDLASFQEELGRHELTKESFETNGPIDIVVSTTIGRPERLAERYDFIKWGEKNLPNMHAIPPGHGPSNHINLNVLGSVVRQTTMEGVEYPIVVPDTILGTDRFFSAINGASILGWNTDPLEIQSLILGNTSRLTMPGVIGLKLMGKIHKGTSPTDIAIAIAAFISKSKPSGKIVEFYGPGLDHLSVHDRAIIARMIGEIGALCGSFPIDTATLNHLTLLGQGPEHLALVEAYAREQGLWRETSAHDGQREPTFTQQLEFSLDAVRPCLSKPRPANVIPIADTTTGFLQRHPAPSLLADPLATVKHGDVILAILSSHETATHPQELLLTGMIARKAARLGLRVKPWVRCLFNDTSPVSLSLLERTGLKQDLEAVGFHFLQDQDTSATSLVQESVEKAVLKNKITPCTIASVPQHEDFQITSFHASHFIASPLLVIGYALAGTLLTDLNLKPLATNNDGKPITLKELLPTTAELNALIEKVPLPPLYATLKESLNTGSSFWQQRPAPKEEAYSWDSQSLFIKKTPILANFELKVPKLRDVKNARLLALYGNDVPASAIAPLGTIAPNSPAAHYLASRNMPEGVTSQYGSFTGNYDVMIRGAFSNPALQNGLLPPGSSSFGLTVHMPSGSPMTIFDAAENYRKENTPYIIVAGKNLGHGVHQEWAAKATRFLGVNIVLAESFAPMFRVNLLRLGVLPLQIKQGLTLEDLKLDGKETLSIAGIADMDRPPCEVMLTIEHPDTVERFMVHCDIKTPQELDMFRNGSLWAYTLRSLVLPPSHA